MIEQAVEPDLATVAARLPDEKSLPAVQILDELKDLSDRILKTNGFRKQINYVYWESLGLAEQEERTVQARKLIYDAEKANAEAELDLAIELYENAFAIWAEIFDDYPILTIDDSAEDLFMSIRRYMIAIDSQDLPEGFPLRTFAEMMNTENGINDFKLYEKVRQEQADLAANRKKELEEEERRREAELKAEAEAETKAAEEKETEEEKDKAEGEDDNA